MLISGLVKEMLSFLDIIVNNGNAADRFASEVRTNVFRLNQSAHQPY